MNLNLGSNTHGAVQRAAKRVGVEAPSATFDDPEQIDDAILAEQRRALRAVYRGLLDDESGEAAQATTVVEARLDAIDDELKTREGADPRRPIPPDGVDGSGADGVTQGGWIDRRTGEPIRTLGPRDSFAALFERPRDNMTLGHCLRAMITGPKNEAERRALSEGTDSAGGFTVPEPLLARFIDRLRARTVVLRSGAITVPMSSQTLSIAKIASDPTATWHAENVAETDSDMTFSNVQFTAHTLLALVRASREVIDDSANAENALEAAFAGALSVELDKAALFGAGGDEPTGISGATGVNSVEMGTDGAAPTDFSEVLDLYQLILDDNAEPPTGAIMAPRTLIQYAKLLDANNQPLQRPNLIADLPYRSTTSVPVDQTQGTATDASTLFLGNWSQLMLGLRSQLRVELLRERYAESYQFGFLAHMRADWQMEHPEAFGELVGITP